MPRESTDEQIPGMYPPRMGEAPVQCSALLAAVDKAIADKRQNYDEESDGEWKRNIGFELQGMRAVRSLIAKAANPSSVTRPDGGR